jgi:hypothetical protein
VRYKDHARASSLRIGIGGARREGSGSHRAAMAQWTTEDPAVRCARFEVSVRRSQQPLGFH